MFERGRSPGAVEKLRHTVVVTLADGRTLRGTLGVIGGQKAADCLNNTEPFLDFQSHDGELSFISKRHVSIVRAIQCEKPIQLQQRVRELALLDPYALLGVEKGASKEVIKHAYHQLARLYHPDRFANLQLPKEMGEYAHVMLTRINLAYEQLGS